MHIESSKFFKELEQAILSDNLVLPSLPDVALKIRDAVESENSSAEQIADAISQDSSLSVRLLKVVNSPLYRTRNPINDLQMAVARLGVRMVRDLIMSLAMKQMFQATSEGLDEKFRDAWNTSVNVASICQMMATAVAGVKKEEALLAGLIHNIGALPILQFAENNTELFNDPEALNSLIWDIQGKVGALILQNWNFSSNLIEVVSECHNFEYTGSDDSPLLYLVQVTLLQGGFVPDNKMPEDWSQVPAFSKLGMETEVDAINITENQQMIEDSKQSLLF